MRVQRTGSSFRLLARALMRKASGCSAVLLLASATCWSSEMPEPPRVGGSSGSGVVSPAVVATWFAREASDGLPKLELLVLWRGTPGWFMADDSDSQGSSVTGSSGVDGEDGRGPSVEELVYGKIRLRLEFDPRSGSARIQDQVVRLDSNNVILVDEVDQAEGPTVAGSRHVDPELSDSPVQIHMIIRRSPELVEFLRCDTRVPDANAQPMFDAMCARVAGP